MMDKKQQILARLDLGIEFWKSTLKYLEEEKGGDSEAARQI